MYSSHATYGYFRRGNFVGSVLRCVSCLNDTFYSKEPEEVNKKLHASNTMMSLYTEPKRHNTQCYRRTDRRTDGRHQEDGGMITEQ